MKKLLLLTLTAVMMAGCLSKRDSNGMAYEVKVIDSCEYIDGGSFSVLGHKGNCRYCAERKKQELKELIKEVRGE